MSWRSSLLKIHESERDSANSLLVIVIYLLQIQKFLLLYYPLNLSFRFLVGEGGTFSAQVSCLSAMETQSLFDASLSLFWGELSDMDNIDIHCVRVFSLGGGRNEGLV